VHALSDLIVPADERSGSASEAGVPEFIDDWLDFRRHEDGTDSQVTQIQGGLAWLDRESIRLFGKDFADAVASEQRQILDRIAWPARAAAADARWARFFSRFRDLTVSGFFSSKMGVADLPYLGNRPVAQWKGCDPEVWAKIEERMKNGYKGLGGEVKQWSD
jgi:gluconate 2-dehydrogenase gamma chain